ncbi:hypothetical protein BIY29_15725 [Brenneria alni]|uniref:Uncharacterized protein n=1 Tax=Brenneria alni TaxID=71656 RepID=A0A421DKH9_9GAMM|nr:hypothetical protein [Brenneria alni]RLM20081.1 hypothetical protein BIY29_15725 [Brenneria alni]
MKEKITVIELKGQLEDGLVVAGFIKERLRELIELLDEAYIGQEELFKEINYLILQYKELVLVAETYNPLTTENDKW